MNITHSFSGVVHCKPLLAAVKHDVGDSMYYILDNNVSVKVEGENQTQVLLEWAKWYEANARTVMKTRLEVTEENRFLMKEKTLGFTEVSTVFLGLDHNHFGGRPLLFETMIFGGEHEGELTRCSTWEEAEAMHSEMIGRLKGDLGR